MSIRTNKDKQPGKVAFITGITGQDGSYLAELLLSKGYQIHGLVRRSATGSTPNIKHILDKIILHYGDLQNEHHLCSLIHRIQPDEIYNLAAQSQVRISFDIPEYTFDINALGVYRLLEAVKNFCPQARMYQASSSEMFGSTPPPHNEESPMHPCSPYACSKLAAYHAVRNYRDGYGIFACNGILFNHESPRRGDDFVTQKVVKGLIDCKYGLRDKLAMGNLDGKRDWGYAGDYVKAMWLMLQQEAPGDWVIGTGKLHSVRDIVEMTAAVLGIDWKNHIVIDPGLLRPTETAPLIADYSKAREQLGWQPTVSAEELIEMMVDHELTSRKAKP